MRLPADCFILYGTHSALSSISVPDADRIHHPGPPPECRRAGSDPDSARRTSIVASDATLPRTLRPVGLAQRHRSAQRHGLPLALAQTPGSGAPGAAAAPASFGQSPAQPPRRRSGPRSGPSPRRVGGVAPRERSAGAPRQPGGWVVSVPASAPSLPGPAQLCRREPQIPGARVPRSSGGLSFVWLGRLAVPAPRRRHLARLTNNTRFLILPWVRVPHLASHILSRVTRCLSHDWQDKYGHPIDLLETFVERDRFVGTAYRAAGWIAVGATTGRGRNGPGRAPQGPVKEVYLQPLSADFRHRLCA